MSRHFNVESNNLRTMKGFPDSFFGFKPWSIIICITILRVNLVQGAKQGCSAIDTTRTEAVISDLPNQKVNTVLWKISDVQVLGLGLEIPKKTLKDALRLYKVNANSWQLKLIKPLHLDQLRYPLAKIQLTCTDESGTIKKDFYLTFEYYNTYAPSFENKTYNVELSETTQINTVVFSSNDKIKDGDFWPTTADGKSIYKYSLKPEDPKFSIESNGDIILKEQLDYESNIKVYDFKIFVKDLGDNQNNVGEEINTTLEIKVLNEDDLSPKFTTKFFHVDIFENVTINSIYSIEPKPKAVDGDNMNTKIIYKLIDKPRGFDKYFEFLNTTMQVKMIKSLDQLPNSNFNVIIKAYQADRPSDRYDTGYLTINVFRVNKNSPVMTKNSYEVSIREHTLVPTILLLVKATDKDGNALEYLMQPQIDGISLNKRNGLITLTKSIDPGNQPITFQVYARESMTAQNRKSKSSLVTIKIINENDHSPEFSESVYNFQIKQTALEIGTVIATDKDQGPNGKLTYDLKGNPSSITINSNGLIKRTSNSHPLKFGNFAFMVTATDKDPNSRSASAFVKVTVLKEDLHPPKFPSNMKTHINILESMPLGTHIMDVFATDDDYDHLTYTVKPNDTFGIDSSTNSDCSFLYLKRKLDAESIPSYSLKIFASDTKHTVSFSLEVTVDGINDNYPIFEHLTYNISVGEDSIIGQSVGTLKAIDKDIHPTEALRYSLGDNSNFKIDPESGMITTLRRFDILETANFSFVAFASDDGSPNNLTGSCLVNINIVDKNNHVPEFKVQSVKLIVLENKMSDLIYHLEATDKDLDPRYNDISYKIRDSPSKFFKLEKKNDLYLKDGQKDKVLGQTVSVIVEAYDTDQPQLTNSINITITFKDINNKVPKLDKKLYQISIPEDTTVWSTICSIQATDDDVAEENKEIEYSIVDWSSKNPFFINATTGVISTWRTLDADGTQNKIISFNVRAENTRKMDLLYNGPSFTEATVKIEVTNVNDNSPKFSQNIYLLQVRETVAKGYLPFQISASDLDNDKISYSLSGDHSPFALDHSTGKLSLSGDLDYEKKSMYNFSVIATDDGQPKKFALSNIVILVEKVNKAPRVNDKMTFSILEEQPEGTRVGCIQASDPDGDPLLYSIDSKDFSVDSTTGELKSKTVFDYEKQKQYKITVTVKDPLHKRSVTATINVIDTNDHDPQFPLHEYKANLTNFNKGSLVIELLAKDHDKNDKITYSLTGDSDFEISLNGKIRLARNLKWKTRENFITLMASANDSKNSSTSVLVSIHLIKPVEFTRNEFTRSISEAAPIGTTVFQLEPCDFVDRTVNIHDLSITLSNKSLVNYDEKCGCILTKAQLDREKLERHVTTMEVKDQYGTVKANLIINIEDVNDEYPILDRVNEVIELSDDSKPGVFIIRMNATDRDKNDGFTFFLKGTCGKFTIDPDSGVIRSCSRLNYRLKPEYHLTVVVIDHGSPPLESNQTVTIKIVNGNRHTPIFDKTSYIFMVKESSPAGHLIGQLSATDKDQGVNGQLSFHIIGGNQDYAFAIGVSNGTVWVNNSKALDYERTKMFQLTVEVNDNGQNPRSSDVRLVINLEDINDNSPEFKSPEFVSKHLPIAEDEIVFTVHAIDIDSSKDGHNRIKYSQQNLKKIFHTNPRSGEVRAISKMSDVKMYTVIFTACDMGGKCAKQNVKLSTYSDVPNVVRVREGIQNELVIDINATDGDFDVFYTLISCNDYFTINSSTGIIRTKKPLVWNSQNNEIPVTVMVHNSKNENHTKEMHIMVRVVDVNDHSPEFPQKTYTLLVDENSVKTFDFQATDMDDGKNAAITYSFFPSDPQVDEGHISLDPTTGILSILFLNREKQNEYIFNIMAKDKGEPPKSCTAEVTIQVQDINDNPPIFTQDEYNATIMENSEPQKVLTVHADDADDGLNKFVYYEIQNNSMPFSINQITGDIWSMEGLDFEKNSVYKLQVLATDQGKKPKTSLCSVSIYVLDICDEVPQLTTVISLSKDRIVGTPVFTLKSSEKGTNYNVSVDHNILAINKKTGNVFTHSEIPQTANTNYHMTVTAWGHCDLPVLTKFEIEPKDPLPKNSAEELKAKITENSCTNESIFNLSSIQGLAGKDVIFTLRTVTDYFRIENGQVYCMKKVDREEHSRIVLLVDVTFKNRPITYTADETLKIVVEVNDVNDNRPQFLSPSLFYSIPSTAPFFYRVEKIQVNDEDDGENGASQFSLSGRDKDSFYINPSTGELYTLFDATDKSEFSLEVTAVDQNGRGLSAKAPLKISIYDDKFNLEMTVNKPVDFLGKIHHDLIGNLSKILGFKIVVDQFMVHQNSQHNPDLQRSDILFHALDLKNEKLVSEKIVQSKIDSKKAAIDNLLNQFGMQIGQVKHISRKPVKIPHKTSSSEVIIIVLACLIFIGCILGIIMAVVMTRRQQKKLQDLKLSFKSASQNVSLEMTNPVFDNADEYTTQEIDSESHHYGRTSPEDSNYNSISSVTFDDSAVHSTQNGNVINQSEAEDLSSQGEPSHHQRSHQELEAKDGYPSVSEANVGDYQLSSSSPENNEEVSEIETIDSPIIKQDSSEDTNTTSSGSPQVKHSVIPGSGGSSENKNSDLDIGDVKLHMSSNASDVDENGGKLAGDSNYFFMHNMRNDEVTEL